MKLGQILSQAPKSLLALGVAATLALMTQGAAAQEANEAASENAGGYVPMAPTEGIGMPVDGGLDVQAQYTELGAQALSLHNALLWIMGAISVFVLLLLVYVMIRYNKKANPVPSKTTHNTMIEVVWTVVPVLILVGIAIPSINLLAKQYESPPEDAVTIKATGYQWYWGYSYPDNGGIEIISNMLPEADAIANGEPPQLAVDNRMVVPANTPLRMQVVAADVIHAFAVPALWFKLDAVPGRLNEKLLIIEEPGVYYGQCSELCGARHGYMPIAVEALPREEWEAWVIEQGGTVATETAEAAETDGETATEATA
ncbi:MAG TPA: cytochrome c oxidase subunit II [Erythrobacter sp.]|nr:cytochrome c oxidase subunit II [Erythrobacter sp.]